MLCSLDLMKTTLIAALLCVAALVLPCAQAQQTEAARKEVSELKAKAEKGDAEAQNSLGTLYAAGKDWKPDLMDERDDASLLH